MNVLKMFFAVSLVLGASACAARSDLASIAQKYEGRSGPSLGLPATLWCADFANFIRKEAGLTPVRSRRAIDQAKGGRRISQPVRGALMITRRGMRGHHVDVVLEVLPGGMVRVAGGNVDGLVRERILPAQGLFVLPG